MTIRHRENSPNMTVEFNNVPFTEETLGRITRAGVITNAEVTITPNSADYQHIPNNRWRDTVNVRAILPISLASSFATMAGFGLN